MKLVVISPAAADPRETALVAEFFAAGLERYHVRKPDWTSGQVRAWIAEVPPQWHSRLILHDHHDLVETLRLGGRHWRDGETAPDAPRLRRDFTSRSCHTVRQVEAALGCYDSVFLSPVFPSISKPGYAPKESFSDLKSVLVHRNAAERRTAVIALGGVMAENASLCHELGFDGVAVLGGVWRSPDPRRAFGALQHSLSCHVH